MTKYPESQAMFARLLTEAGFRNDDGTYNRKGFCKATGMNAGMCNHFIAGTAKLSIEKLTELCNALNISLF